MNELLNLTDGEIQNALCPSPITPDAWTFTGKELKETIQGKRLLNVSIDLPNECNLNCPYCFTAPADSSQRGNNTEGLSFEEYKDIINQLKIAGTKTINIIGAGEPPMYPYFEELTRFISLQGMKVCVATNGILLASQNRFVDLLNDIGATIILKVNSRDRHLQDIIVGRNGYSTLRDNALTKLLNKGFNKETPTRLAINTLLIKSIYTELYDIFLFCRENNISLIASVYMPTGRTSGLVFHGKQAIPHNMHILEELYNPLETPEISALLYRIKKYDSENNITRATFPAYISGMACTQLLGIQIDNQGKVWSCPARKIKDENIVSEKVLSKSWKLFLQDIDNNKIYKGIINRYNGACIYKFNSNVYR